MGAWPGFRGLDGEAVLGDAVHQVDPAYRLDQLVLGAVLLQWKLREDARHLAVEATFVARASIHRVARDRVGEAREGLLEVRFARVRGRRYPHLLRGGRGGRWGRQGCSRVWSRGGRYCLDRRSSDRCFLAGGRGRIGGGWGLGG